jgi:hypothetical protein
MEMWRHGDIETWTWRHGDTDMETSNGKGKNGSLVDFPEYIYHLLIVQTEVCHLFVC